MPHDGQQEVPLTLATFNPCMKYDEGSRKTRVEQRREVALQGEDEGRGEGEHNSVET